MPDKGMEPTLIGYFAKRTEKRPEWLAAPGVEEICSVSDCISQAADGWQEHSRHNEMWAYDSPELAWTVVDDGSRDQFELYAWKLFPFEFDDAERRPAVLPSLHVQPLPASFELLGYDIVSRYSSGSCFECSPLSCNHLAEEIAVNRHCLLADAPTALRLASEFETMGGEPGPCLVVEVWRQRRAVS